MRPHAMGSMQWNPRNGTSRFFRCFKMKGHRFCTVPMSLGQAESQPTKVFSKSTKVC